MNNSRWKGSHLSAGTFFFLSTTCKIEIDIIQYKNTKVSLLLIELIQLKYV